MSAGATPARGDQELSPSPRFSAPAKIAWVFAGAALWLALLAFPAEPIISLDWAWKQGLIYAFKHHLRAGVDYAFNYGPLGFCINPRSFGMPFDHDLFYFQVAWEIVVVAIMAAIIMAAAARGRSLVAKTLLVAFAFVALPISKEAAYLFTLVAGTIAIVEGQGRATAQLVAFVVLAAAASLVKLTFAIMSVISVIAVTAVLTRRSKTAAAATAAAFVSLLAVGWYACGQSVHNLPSYLAYSWELTSGHSDAHAIEGPFGQVILAVAMIAAIAAMAALSAFQRPVRFARFVTALVAGAGLFMAWKAGFARQDLHVFTFFRVATCVALVIPLPEAGRVRKVASTVMLLAVAAMGTAGVFAADTLAEFGHTLRAAAVAVWDHAKTSVAVLESPAAARRVRDEQCRALALSAAMPLTVRTVGAASIDIFSYDQQLLFLNGLNWRGRPVFHSYLAYTPKLMAANAAFFDAATAPDYVLLALQPVDRRFPTIEDSAALRRVFADYAPLFVEKGHLLLKRTGATPAPRLQSPLLAVTTSLNKRIDIGALSQGPQTLSVDVEYTLLGKLRTFLYRAPILRMRVTTDRGEQAVYRLPPAMAKAPFVINPLISGQDDLFAWFEGKPLGRVMSVEIRASQKDLKYFKPQVTVRVAPLGFRLKGFPAGAGPAPK